MLSADFREEKKIKNIFSQLFTRSKFAAFLFSVPGFDNMLMFLERVVVCMILFFLTALCRIFEVGKTKWCGGVNSHQIKRDKKLRLLQTASA